MRKPRTVVSLSTCTHTHLYPSQIENSVAQGLVRGAMMLVGSALRISSLKFAIDSANFALCRLVQAPIYPVRYSHRIAESFARPLHNLLRDRILSLRWEQVL